LSLRWIDYERFIHSIKTAVACIIGFLLTRFIGFSADQWVVVTIIVVMCAQIYVGSVLQKAYLRFLGTLAGCLVAMITLATIGNTQLTILVTIGISSAVFSYIATSQETLSYAGTLGAVTAAIIMLGHEPSITFASERFVEISLGILIASTVSQFFLPIHARTHLRRSQATTLSQLRDYYSAIMTPERSDNDTLAYQELDETIVKTLLKQRQLAKESLREPLGLAFDPKKFMQTLYAEREMLRATTFMHTALMHLKVETVFSQLPALTTFNTMFITALSVLITKIEEKNNTQSIHLHLPNTILLKENLEKQIDISSREELIYLDSLLFAAEILIANLEKLATIYEITIDHK